MSQTCAIGRSIRNINKDGRSDDVRRLPNIWKKVLYHGGSPGDVSEVLVTKEKQKKGWRMNCDIGEATNGLENEL